METQRLKEKTSFLRKKFSSIVEKINKSRVTGEQWIYKLNKVLISLMIGLILNEYIDFINELGRHVDESKWIELTLMEERWKLVLDFIERNMETTGIDRQKLLESFNKSKILASKISFVCIFFLLFEICLSFTVFEDSSSETSSSRSFVGHRIQ